MELHGEDISAGNRASKRRWIIYRRDRYSGVTRLRVITVREIESRAIVDAAQQRMRPQLAHRTPPHMRHLQPLATRIDHRSIAKADDVSSKNTQARCGPFLAGIKEHLQAKTYAQERPIPGNLQNDVTQPAGVELAHAIRHRALPGKHDPCRLADDRRLRSDDDGALGSDIGQRFGNRAQIAHAVVYDSDVGHQESGIGDQQTKRNSDVSKVSSCATALYRTPFVDGTMAPARSSGSTAMRSARAKAL